MVGDRRYRVDANTATDVTDPDTSKHRRASVSADYELRWVGAAEGVAFLVADRVREKYDPDKPGTNRRFHRLDLGLMKWLDPFELPEPSIDRDRGNVGHFGSAPQKPRRHVLADHLLVTPRGIVALCEETIEQQNMLAPDIIHHVSVGYHVSCYAPKDTRAKWTRAIRDVNRGRRVVGYSMRSYDDGIERLAYVPGSDDDDLILLCRGERDAVICLAGADGKVCWRIPAIWEYERGFIGPSTFLHYIERFGLDFMAMQAATSPVLRGDEEEIDPKQLREQIRWKMESRRKLAAASKAFYARYQGRITAGPIVAPGADQFGNPRIYVAATRSLKPEPGCVEQPEHAFVYEIEPHRWDGPEITGMTRLPRAVIGRPYRKVPGGFVLSCSQGCMVRLRTYEPVFGGIMGPGNAADDLVLQIDWYREYLMRGPSAWFNADPTDVAGFSKARLFRPIRAYVRRKEDKVYDLQINVVDLRTGLDRDLTLSVPFEGKLPIPESGLSSFNRGDPTEQLHAHGPHAVWIDHLGVDGDRLTVAVAHGSQCTALTFDLSAILGDEQASSGE